MPQTGPWGRETEPGELDPLPGFQKHHGGHVYEKAEPVRARLELMNLRDNGDLEEYIGKAQNMESGIPDLSEAEEMVALVNGLASREKEAVLRYGAESRTTIVEICRYVYCSGSSEGKYITRRQGTYGVVRCAKRI
ncbi:MAG: uncharacterized protein A8A55_3239 [Amphiamblys sp. WSBS2006]|nr:MAG: uncharacterized protein A8A55_3239 [Amphiamblys sp. WSBS2006]